MSSAREEKRLVYAPKSLVDKAIEAAKRSGVALSVFVERSLSFALKTHDLGYDFDEALEVLRAFKLLKTFGGVFVPKHLYEYYAGNTGELKSELEKWHECGRLYGLYLRERAREPLKTLKALLEVSRWDLLEVILEEGGGKYKLKCASGMLTAEDTERLVEFVKGILEGIGAKLVSLEAMRGLVVVEFEYKEQKQS